MPLADMERSQRFAGADQQSRFRYAREMNRRREASTNPSTPVDDPTDAYMRVLSRQATEREMRAGTGRTAAFLTPDSTGRYRLGGGR